jgi:WD40 repeat protein
MKKKILTSLRFSPDGSRLVSGSDHPDNTVRLWEATSGRPQAILAGHKNIISAVAFSPDGTRLTALSGISCALLMMVPRAQKVGLRSSPTTKPGVARKPPHQSRRGCTCHRVAKVFCALPSRGALRDPGLCCETASRSVSTRMHVIHFDSDLVSDSLQ